MTKYSPIIIILIIVLIGGALFLGQKSQQSLPFETGENLSIEIKERKNLLKDEQSLLSTKEKIKEETGKKNPLLSLEDVAKHPSESDCWLAINTKVYNVTDFIPSHPGGKALLQGCGKDATEFFETRPMGSGTPHSQKARDLLKDFYIGDLE